MERSMTMKEKYKYKIINDITIKKLSKNLFRIFFNLFLIKLIS
ncbi:hypothetical protein [Spiroplasma endosymbiont of Dactylopius coccus]